MLVLMSKVWIGVAGVLKEEKRALTLEVEDKGGGADLYRKCAKERVGGVGGAPKNFEVKEKY